MWVHYLGYYLGYTLLLYPVVQHVKCQEIPQPLHATITHSQLYRIPCGYASRHNNIQVTIRKCREIPQPLHVTI